MELQFVFNVHEREGIIGDVLNKCSTVRASLSFILREFLYCFSFGVARVVERRARRVNQRREFGDGKKEVALKLCQFLKKDPSRRVLFFTLCLKHERTFAYDDQFSFTSTQILSII